MIKLLVKIFVKDPESRESFGYLGGWVGLVTNLLLFGVKIMVGFVTSSLSIMTDAINNLADGSSSLITLVGFKIAAMPADEEHPYGHARSEYISGLLVACLVMIIGVQFLISSVKKTINPQPTKFSSMVVVLLLLSIGLKVWQAYFNYTVGKHIESTVLLATAVDSRNDVVITLAVLISSVIEHFTDLMLDGPMGILVALFVLYSGVGLMRDTLTPLIGQAPSKEMVKMIKDKVRSYDSVLDIHDLIVHNYGPEQIFATIHVEMPAAQDILKSHEIIDGMERDFLKNHNIDLVVHLDPVDTTDPEWETLEKAVTDFGLGICNDFSVHGFRLVRGHGYTRLLFDVTVPPQCEKSDRGIRKEFTAKIQELDGTFEPVITIDRSYLSTIN